MRRIAEKPVENTLLALRNLVGYALVAALFVTGVFLFRKPMEDPLEHTIHMLGGALSTDRLTALSNLQEFGTEKERWLPLVLERLHDEDVQVRRSAVDLLTTLQERAHLLEMMTLLNDKSDEVRRSVLNAVKALGESRDGEELIRVARDEEDPEMKVAFLATAFEVGNANAALPLVDIIAENGMFADDAYHALRAHVQFEFTRTEISKFTNWWKSNRNRIIWDKPTGMFIVQLGRERHG